MDASKRIEPHGIPKRTDTRADTELTNFRLGENSHGIHVLHAALGGKGYLAAGRFHDGLSSVCRLQRPALQPLLAENRQHDQHACLNCHPPRAIGLRMDGDGSATASLESNDQLYIDRESFRATQPYAFVRFQRQRIRRDRAVRVDPQKLARFLCCCFLGRHDLLSPMRSLDYCCCLGLKLGSARTFRISGSRRRSSRVKPLSRLSWA